MGIEAIHYRRRFDWFNLLYPIVPVIFLYGILRAADANPLELPWFWIVLGLIALSQIIYFIFAARSPDQLHLDDDNLVARWSSKCREVSVPRIEVRIRKSYLFTGGYRISSRGESFFVFPGHEQGRKLVEELLNPEWHLE